MLIFATLVREETLTVKFIQACNKAHNQKEFIKLQHRSFNFQSLIFNYKSWQKH